MVGKKQILTMISVAVVAFLIGTTFNAVTIAREGANPFGEIWEAIESINESMKEGTRIIRFVQPDETVEDEGVYREAATFTYSPRNATNNAILAIAYYFDLKHEQTLGVVDYRIEIWGPPPHTVPSMIVNFSSGIRVWHTEYRTSYIGYLEIAQFLFPNKSVYTIRLFVKTRTVDYIAYVKNINFILTVADGIPASNQ